MIALGAAVGFGISIALVKSLTRTETDARDHLLDAGGAVDGRFRPDALCLGLATAYLWGWIVVIAVCGTFSHFCMARAMLYADATIVVPMDFLRVPSTATVGWLLYAERLDAFTVLGAALIPASAIS